MFGSVPSQEDERSCCLRGIYFASSFNFSVSFWNCSDRLPYFSFNQHLIIITGVVNHINIPQSIIRSDNVYKVIS